MKFLTENAKDLYPYIDAAGERIRHEINEFCQEKRIKAKMYGVGSICRLIMSDQDIRSARHRDEVEAAKDVQKAYYNRLLEKGIHVAANRLMFISAAHDEEQISTIIDAYKDTFNEFSTKNSL